MEQQFMTEEDLFESKPDVVSGALVFKGTRIPVEPFFENLAAGLSLDDVLRNYPGIGRERADLVLAGCAILEAICRSFPCPRLRVADRGLREGMLVSLMREDGVWERASAS